MKNAPNMSKKANELLHNRFILYFVFIIAVANLFHFVFSHDLMSVCVFIVAGLLTSFFSKNMVVIMVISIVVTHVVRFGNGGYEGFESLEEQVKEILDEEEEDEKMADNDEEEEEEEGPEGFKQMTPRITIYRANKKNKINTFDDINKYCKNEKCYMEMNGKMKPLNIAHGIPTMYKDGKEITTIDDYNRYCRTGKCTRKKTSKNSSKKSSGVNKDEIQKMVEEIAEEKVNEIVNEQIRV
jgi:hypothetical protein